jgi:cytidine deaminase
MEDADLLVMARKAAQKAYCPYSRFQVGAALLTSEGRVFTGCNVENASYGLTICAERTALSSAIAAGQQQFEAMAIVATRAATPCGACRQVLAEFVSPAFRVLVAPLAEIGRFTIYTMAELLPHGFVLDETHTKGSI